MGQRLNLSNLLRNLLGSNNVYFEPPSDFKMKFPCIVYERAKLEPDYADNLPYKIDKVYYVTCIYDDPDSDLPLKLAQLPMSVQQRHYQSDNKHYDQFRLVY
ncbi:hypothetical protein SAMN02910342_00119 [Butyrivibrio sp. INlla21]|nr:hypothetical protein SAMN02910342_00119 [Butyrivibrio sp. INlla21]